MTEPRAGPADAPGGALMSPAGASAFAPSATRGGIEPDADGAASRPRFPAQRWALARRLLGARALERRLLLGVEGLGLQPPLLVRDLSLVLPFMEGDAMVAGAAPRALLEDEPLARRCAHCGRSRPRLRSGRLPGGWQSGGVVGGGRGRGVGEEAVVQRVEKVGGEMGFEGEGEG